MNDKELTEILISRLLQEKQSKANGVYYYTQIDMAYNSNRIEGSMLSQEQTACLFDTKTIIADKEQVVRADDIMETINHFRTATAGWAGLSCSKSV